MSITTWRVPQQTPPPGQPSLYNGINNYSAPRATSAPADSVQFSGKSEKLKLAEQLAELAGMDPTSILNQIEQSLPRIIKALRASGIAVTPQTEDVIQRKFPEIIREEGFHIKQHKLIVEAYAKTYSTPELHQLIELYSDPATAKLLKKQMLFAREVLVSPKYLQAQRALTQKLTRYILDIHRGRL